MSTQIINTIGISLTMIGAILIAVDVTRQYKGKKIDVSPGIVLGGYMGGGGNIVAGQDAKETEEYKQWQKINFRLMAFGLAGILIGGFFQIVACWM